jgi:peroxiredoxin
MTWGRWNKFLLALICAAILGTQSTELTWNQSQAGQSIFHSYSKPLRTPEFSLEDLQGKMVNIRDHRGQVILINFWATWCPNCRKEGSSFEKLFTKYKTKGLILFRIDTKESRETITKFLEKNPVNVPVLLDTNGKVGRLFGVWAHPTSYLIDRQGIVRYRAVGFVDWTGPEALSVIDVLLREG